jgi:Ferritin-like
MKHGAFASLTWVKPPRKRKALPIDLEILAQSPVGEALRDNFLKFGIPRPRDRRKRKTPQAEAAALLHAAAEVEHTLLVEYLYAAFSIDPLGPLKKLQGVILRIAVEEMGHLITVQNLLIALGEEPYLDREGVNLGGKPAGQYPFPVTFEPLSADSLAKYVTTECMPLEQLPANMQSLLRPIFLRARKAAHRTVHHVGLLYATIFWLFQADDKPNPYWPTLPLDCLPHGRHIPDKALKGLSDPHQVQAPEFGRTPVTPSSPGADDVYVIQIKAREDALFAIALIAAQGESYTLTSDSHFLRFYDAYNQYASSLPTGVRDVPTDPSAGDRPFHQPLPESGRITDLKAKLWARLFDHRYQLLILELALGVQTAPGTAGPLGRDSLFSDALGEMTERIRQIGDTLLPSMPLKKGGGTQKKAAAPFGLPETALPTTLAAIRKRMKALLQGAAKLSAEIENLRPPDSPTTDELKVLTQMQADDQPLIAAL